MFSLKGKKINQFIIPGFGILVVLVLVVFPIMKNKFGMFDPRDGMTQVSTTIGKNKVVLWQADSEMTRARGLSGLDALPQGRGMLFIFDTLDFWGIWMKEMRFPIDIVWLDSNFSVVHVEKNADPATYPSIFFPKKKAKYVIELPKGDTDRLNIVVGQTLLISK